MRGKKDCHPGLKWTKTRLDGHGTASYEAEDYLETLMRSNRGDDNPTSDDKHCLNIAIIY
jgi:hypothetical protein